MSVQRYSPTRAFAVLGVLLGVALAASPARAVIVFSDDFESYAPDANIFGGGSVWRSLDTATGLIKARTDTGPIFGAGNQYMEYVDDSTANHPEMSASFTPIVGQAARLSFDFYEPTDAAGGVVRFSLANDLDNNNSSGSNERTIELQIGGRTIAQSSGNPGAGMGDFLVSNAYALDTVNHIDVIANYGNEAYTYSLGNVVNGTVASKKIDILLNGQLLNTGFDLDFRGENMHDMVDLIHVFNNNGGESTLLVDNLVVRAAAPFVTIDRTTGNVTLTNDTGSPLENIVGYSIISEAGTLNSNNWNSLAGSNPSWQELTGEPGEDLSEAALNAPFTPHTVPDNGTINFGNVWHRNPAEDIQFELLLDDGSDDGLVVPVFVQYSGGTGGFDQFVLGDLNFDGAVDGLDAERFGEYGFTELAGDSPGATYTFGDMNGDLVSNYEDLVLFRAAYDAANGAGAFASLTSATAVPEPSTLLLGGFALCGALALRRRAALKATAMCGALLACVALLPAAHADIVFQENFNGIPAGTLIDDTTDSAFTETVSNTAAPNDASVLADTGNLFGQGTTNNYFRYEDAQDAADVRLTGPANLTGTNVFQLSFDFHDPGTAEDIQDIRIGLSDASASGASTTLDFQFRQSYFHYRSTNPPDGSLGNYSVNYNTGQTYGVTGLGNAGPSPVVYNDGNDWIAPGTFDVWVDGQKVSDNVPMPPGRPPTTHLTIHSTNASTGDMYFDNIEVHDTIDAFDFEEAVLNLQVNTDTGQVSIRNTYNLGFDISLDYYRITGDAGALNPTGWNSLDDQEGADPPGTGWVEAGSSNSAMLWEFANGDLQADVGFASPLSLGAAFNTASGAGNSLTFEYAVNGGQVITGLVSLISGTSPLPGDFNGDGVVDAADYTVWRNNLGGDEAVLGGNGNNNGVVDAGDYTLWKGNFGETAPGALGLASAQVPEPSSVVLLGMAACGMLYFFRRQRSFTMVPVRFAALAVAATILASSAHAAITVDRLYTMGDEVGEGGANGPEIDEPVNSTSGRPVYDSVNNPLYEDLDQSGNPVYAPARPGAAPWAIAFNGSMEQYLFHEAPLDNFASGSQGMQMWVNPDAASVGTGRQGIVFNGTNGGGPAISASGHWTQYNAGSSSPGSLAGTTLVEGGQWYHVAQHVFANTDTAAPGIVPGTGAARSHTSVIYVDGVAVSATNFNLAGTNTGSFVIGAEGTTPTNFFSGVVDHVEVYTSTANGFNLLADNEYIAAQLPGSYENYKPGDINLDGQVDELDVAAFVAGWRMEKRFEGAHNDLWVGDLETLGWGDINLDGRVDLKDAYRLNKALQASGAAALDFALLEGAAVPEPSSVVLLLGASLAGVAVWKRRRA